MIPFLLDRKSTREKGRAIMTVFGASKISMEISKKIGLQPRSSIIVYANTLRAQLERVLIMITLNINWFLGELVIVTYQSVQIFSFKM